MKEKNTHGGAGRGQGRHKNPEKKVKISPSVKPAFKKKFSEYAADIKESQGDIITRLVEKEMEEPILNNN